MDRIVFRLKWHFGGFRSRKPDHSIPFRSLGTIGNSFHRGDNEIVPQVGGRLWGASLESAGGDAGGGARAPRTWSVIVLHLFLNALGQFLDLFRLLDHV